MRVLVFFDLPTEKQEDRRVYSKFRKFLIKYGFVMLQESVYAKLSLNFTQTEQIIKDVKNARPEKGIVQILTVTEKQFNNMEMISGKINNSIIQSDERLLLL